MLSLLRQPRWILFTLLVPVGVALCLMAADWQYQRHVNRSTQDALAEANSANAPVPLPEVVAVKQPLEDADAYRQVVIQGQFDADATVLVRRRVFNGSPGYWVVTPLQTDTGKVQVLRGWVATAGDALTSPTVAPPPSGTVTVVGWLKPSESLPDPPPTDLPAGQVAALDTAVLNGASAGFLPVVVAMAMEPADPAGLTALPVPDPGLGPHLAYSWQWIAFAAMLPIGWIILARRELKGEQASDQPDQETASADL